MTNSRTGTRHAPQAFESVERCPLYDTSNGAPHTTGGGNETGSFYALPNGARDARDGREGGQQVAERQGYLTHEHLAGFAGGARTEERRLSRFCVDYRRLNAKTAADSYPLPRMNDCIDSLGHAAVSTTLDSKLGYWQIPVAPEDRVKPRSPRICVRFAICVCRSDSKGHSSPSNGHWISSCPA